MDSKETIQHSLQDYKSFYALVEARKEQRKQTGKDLNNFFVLGGTIQLDHYGQVMKFYYEDSKFGPIVPLIEGVLTKEELEAIRNRDNLTAYGTFIALPKPDDTCLYCQKGWDMTTFKDFKHDHSLDINMHLSCKAIVEQQRTLESFQQVFKLAGFDYAHFRNIDNQYWPAAYKNEWYVTDWYDVKTLYGNIRIGNRKRVIEIDWSDIGEIKLDIKDDVTKNNKHIHAWSTSKAIEYLRELKGELQRL